MPLLDVFKSLAIGVFLVISSFFGLGEQNTELPPPLFPENPLIVEEKSAEMPPSEEEKEQEEPEPKTEPEPEEPPPETAPVADIEPSEETDSEPDFNALNTEVRPAIVNILCSTDNGSLFPISGSGVVIDPRGIILTNAHIAQYQLVAEHYLDSLTCTIRTGNPARNTYTTELMYFPPQWAKEHGAEITNRTPRGTGEHDYALLRITGHVDADTDLPESFPFIPPTLAEPLALGEQVLLAAYPAGFLDSATIQTNLFQSTATAVVQKRFVFAEGEPIGLVSIGGTILSQGGASGGAAITGTGELAALIVTRSDGETTAERDLRALTTTHIDESTRAALGFGLATLLEQDPATYARTFRQTIAPTLVQYFIPALEE